MIIKRQLELEANQSTEEVQPPPKYDATRPEYENFNEKYESVNPQGLKGSGFQKFSDFRLQSLVFNLFSLIEKDLRNKK